MDIIELDAHEAVKRYRPQVVIGSYITHRWRPGMTSGNQYGVDNLKMSDYGFTREECDTLARNARDTMGGLFAANPCEMTHEDCAAIFEKAYR